MAQPRQMQLTYVDRPEVSETFADFLHIGVFEGLTVKMEFLVNRPNPAQPGGAITGRSVTACRLIMPLPGIIDLIGKLQGLIASLQAQGVVIPGAQGPVTVN
jgi:hypothetical protein